MRGKENTKTEGPETQGPETRDQATASQTLPVAGRPLAGAGQRPYDVEAVLATLGDVFATFRSQLGTSTETPPPPFDDPAARLAVNTFNDVLAGLRLTVRPGGIKVSGRAISSTQIELTWFDDSSAADGYRIKRCQGPNCQDLVEIPGRQPLLSGERSFRDCNLSSNTTYRYQVVAFNLRGETSSSILSVTTTSSPT